MRYCVTMVYHDYYYVEADSPEEAVKAAYRLPEADQEDCVDVYAQEEEE